MDGLGTLRSSRGMRLDEGLGHFGDLLADRPGHLFQEFLDPVGVEIIDDVDLGVHQHGVGPQVHSEQPQDIRDLGEREHGLAYQPPILGEHRFTDQEPARVRAEFPGDEQ